MKITRIAVIGTGYLGKFHAEKYHQLKHAELIAVCDLDLDRAQGIAKSFGCQSLSDYTQLIGHVDAVCIATPTPSHFDIAHYFLANHIHVFIEKPITTTIDAANKLIDLANQNDCILQVGHLERFNSAVTAMSPFLNNPRFIESTRLAPFNKRGSDVNVILDLMIHDIDLIQFIVNDKIKHISATGASLITPFIDIGNARLEFENGAVANVTASRISLKKQRKIRLFQADAYISTDLDKRKFVCHQKKGEAVYPDMPDVKTTRKSFKAGDAILAEVKAFLHSIQTEAPAVVNGEAGRDALATAIEITRIMQESNHG